MVIKDNRKRLEAIEKCKAGNEDVFKHIKLDICHVKAHYDGSDVFNEELREEVNKKIFW